MVHGRLRRGAHRRDRRDQAVLKADLLNFATRPRELAPQTGSRRAGGHAMTADMQSERARSRSVRHRAGPALALGFLLCLSAAASAQQKPNEESPPAQPEQTATPAPETAAPAAPVQPPRADGLFGTIGRWIDGSIASVNKAWKGKPENAPGEAREGAGIALLPKTKIVSGRERCDTGPNGAPDCRRAVEALCRRKGLAPGKSLDVESVDKCSAQVWISGAQPRQGECRKESYVQRAFCK
jgi:hypothetical protein